MHCVLIVSTIFRHLATVPNDKSELESYKAVYKISLEDRDYQSFVDNISGKMLYELEELCQGWILRQNIVTHFSDQAGEAYTTRSNYVIWESSAHDELKFYYRYFMNGILVDEVEGRAYLSEEKGHYAEFSVPYALKIKLPTSTIFPVQHLKHVAQLLKDKRPIDEHHVFDGTTLDYGYLVNSTAHQVKNDAQGSHPFSFPFKDKRYAVHMAYYDKLSFQSKSAYVVDVDMNDSGVQFGTVTKFSDFSVRHKLKKFKILSGKKCPLK